MVDKKNILIIEDEEGVREFICILLKECGYNCNCISGHASDMLSNTKNYYDLIISDVHLQGENGFDSIKLSKVFGNTTPVLFISGLDYEKEVKPYKFLSKPFSCNELINTVKELINEE